MLIHSAEGTTRGERRGPFSFSLSTRRLTGSPALKLVQQAWHVYFCVTQNWYYSKCCITAVIKKKAFMWIRQITLSHAPIPSVFPKFRVPVHRMAIRWLTTWQSPNRQALLCFYTAVMVNEWSMGTLKIYSSICPPFPLYSHSAMTNCWLTWAESQLDFSRARKHYSTNKSD